ncbi:hypothetical protein V2J09_023238 [Rumex salicifolius]
MKKALDQTIRDLKRGVNKKVLKVPSIEQKVLDATSNEPWGPHGSLLADIAQASRNYHEYQMIMTIMWKRINSTGKNWRHALTVMEYMVANGSERVIDEIREHAYQISTLSSFQYIDSSGRDQGLNVRRKSQSLVSLVNDKEKIQEVREKAASNKDKFRSASMGGTNEPGSYSGAGYGDRYDDERYAGRYGSRDDERNGYGREGEWSNRDEDRYGRDSEERYGRGNYRDDDHRGRYADESGSRSSDRDRDRAYDDEHHSSRGSSVKAEDQPQEGRPLERKFSEQNIGAPPSYEEAIGGSKSPVYSERDGDTPAVPAAPVPKPASPTANTTPSQTTADPTTADPSSSWSDPNNKAEAVDEFDPRGSVAGSDTSAPTPAVSGTSNNAEMDLIGSLSDSWAITPVSSVMSSTDPNASGSFVESQFMTTSSPPTMNQSFEDPFGDSPFKALSSSDDVTTQAQNFASVPSFQSSVNSLEQTQQFSQMNNNFEAQETFSSLNFGTPDASGFQLPPNAQPVQQETFSLQNDDILAGILPPSGPPEASQTPFTPPVYQPTMPMYNAPNFVQQSGPQHAGNFPIAAQNQMMPTYQNSNMNFLPQSTPALSGAPNTAPQMPVTVPQQTNNFLGDLLPHAGQSIAPPSQPTSTQTTGSLALVPLPAGPAPTQKFELKSAVWADTLSRGLVDLNISGPKVNPNADIGVDFVSLNRKDKRMEKPTAAPVASTINMGKAMGSGSGMGRSGPGMIKSQSSPIIGSGMGMGMGGAPGMGMGMGMGSAPGMGMGMGMGGAPGAGMAMGGYGMMNQRPNMGMGMGMGMGGNMGMGTGQGAPMMNQHPGSNMSGGYNPMMARGGYPPQQPYGSNHGVIAAQSLFQVSAGKEKGVCSC